MASKSVKSVKKSIKDPDLTNMFNQMVGASDPDPNIVLPKYENVLTKIKNILKLFESFASFKHPFYVHFGAEYKKGFHEIHDFIKQGYIELGEFELEKNDEIISGEELAELNKDPSKIMEFLKNQQSSYKIKNLKKRWDKLKECKTVQEIIFIARNIKGLLYDEMKRSKNSVHNLQNKDSLSCDFITNIEGDFLKLFPFSTLEFKQIFLSDTMNPELSKYILFFMYILYKDTIFVVETITSPDIDIESFSHLLVGQIGKFKKMIPRCDMAFKKIEDSVGLLQKNFGKYYKDFIISRDNPSIMIENFVLDVANSCEQNGQLVSQFREIMKYINKHMSTSKVNDPKMQKMYDMLSGNLDLLEKKT